MPSAALKVLFLDRDGVINRDSVNYIRSVDEWIPLPGALESIAELSRNGWRIGVATNQSGIGRKFYTADTLAAIHGELNARLNALGGRIEAIEYCPHHPRDDCACRKPKSGMLLKLGERLGVSPQGVAFVGDSLRDLQAARAAGCKPVLVRTGYGENTLNQLDAKIDDDVTVVDSLAAYAEQLLSEPQET